METLTGSRSTADCLLPCSYGCTWLLRRFIFKLSPGQETDKALGLRSFFTLGPAEGIFVTPVQRHEE